MVITIKRCQEWEDCPVTTVYTGVPKTISVSISQKGHRCGSLHSEHSKLH